MTTDAITLDEDGLARIPKDPNAVLDYSWNWATWLGTDTIANYVIEVDGVTKDSDSRNGAVITAWLSGGAAGSIATATCRVTTAAGRVDDRTIYLDVADR
jgi:hypothetical protein